jgi:DNA-binding transcriptional MocR family regulator
MLLITRAQAAAHTDALARLAHGPTRRHAGTKKLRHSPLDAAVYAALVSHQNWRTGQCNPGMRALARLARCALGTVQAAIQRLRAAGYIQVRRFPIRVPGHGYRWCHAYTLLPTPRSEIVAEPVFSKNLIRKKVSGPVAAVRTPEEQLAELARLEGWERAGEGWRAASGLLISRQSGLCGGPA